MKFSYIILLIAFSFSSCVSSEKDTIETKKLNEIIIPEEDDEAASVLSKIAHEWILINRTNTKKDKSIEFSVEAPSIITHFETNGFFSTFDLIEIKDNKENTLTLQARFSGQWEVHNENELVMHYSYIDSVARVESYIIQQLDDKHLVIKNSEKDIIDSYQRKD